MKRQGKKALGSARRAGAARGFQNLDPTPLRAGKTSGKKRAKGAPGWLKRGTAKASKIPQATPLHEVPARNGEQGSLPGIARGPSQAVRRQSGEAAEKRADAMHGLCARNGVAVVRRVASNVRAVRSPHNGAVLSVAFVGKSTVDCWGVLAGGRAVAVEIKGAAEGRLALDRLVPHQRQELAQVATLGGLALVLVIGRADCWAVPWPAVEAAIEAGAVSLGPTLLAPYRCDPWRPYLAAFLPSTAAEVARASA